MKIVGVVLLVLGTVTVASASVPEIDGSSALTALALLSGSVLMITSRRKK